MSILITRKLFDTFFEPGSILFFKNPGFPQHPHPHIYLVDKDDNVVLMACGTSQRATVENFIRQNNLPTSSVVWVDPQPDNRLYKETYINCNDMPFDFSRDVLMDMYNAGELELFGNLTQSKLEEVLQGFIESELIDGWVQDLLKPILVQAMNDGE